MRTLSQVILLLAVIMTGCTTTRHVSSSWGRASHGYTEDVIGLHLTQDAQSADLLLTLTNVTEHPITNFFPQTVFEGSIWVVQEGTVPLRTYPSNYFNLLTKGFWCNPATAIPAAGCLHYRIPLGSLVCPFSSRRPDATRPLLAYGWMDGLDAVSNVIPLRNQERIQWRTNSLHSTPR